MDRETLFKNYVAWLEENGCELKSLDCPAYFEGVQGVAAARDIKRGEVAFKVNNRVTITNQSIHASPLAPLVLANPDIF